MKGKCLFIDVESYALEAFLEYIVIEKLSIESTNGVCLVFDSILGGFSCIDQVVIVEGGTLIFNINDLECAVLNCNENDQAVELLFQDGSYIEVLLSKFQGLNLERLIKLVENGLSKRIIGGAQLDENLNRCPCCIKRVEAIRENTVVHPVARLIQHHVNCDDIVLVEFSIGSLGGSCYLDPTDVSFVDGIATIYSAVMAQLDLTIIHGVHLYCKKIGRDKYSFLEVHNSMAQGAFSIGVLGESNLKLWKDIFDSTPHDHSI